MQFHSLDTAFEVNGQIVDGFRLFRRLASAVLQCEGIGRMRSDLEIDRAGRYPQQAWLRAFQRIAEEAGQARGGCWCDSACTNYGDCCSDYEDICVPI